MKLPWKSQKWKLLENLKIEKNENLKIEQKFLENLKIKKNFLKSQNWKK